MNFGLTSLAAPNAASWSVARYSLIAACGFSSTLLAPLRSRDRALLIRVRRNQASIDCKSFAADQPCRNARLHNMLEETAENVAVAKPLIACTRERRVVRDLVFD